MKKMNKGYVTINFGTQTKSGFYFWFWTVLSVVVSLLTSATMSEAPGKALVGATFLMVGHILYPTVEAYYGGFDHSIFYGFTAKGVRFFDGGLGIGLFIGAVLNIMLF
jgi:hypothetical protein